jgi:hypothetical protein
MNERKRPGMKLRLRDMTKGKNRKGREHEERR